MNRGSKTEWSGRHQDKDKLRAEIWSRLEQQGEAIGRPFGHIPNFRGADRAAARLASLPVWQQARVVKCNPDSAQAPVRLQALQADKILYMAVPRLTREAAFVELKAGELQQHGITLKTAATLKGAMQHGRLVGFAEMQPIDLVVTGCVAVARDGGRTGKGAGFADLELGMLSMFELVGPQTPVVITVHPSQIVEPARLPMLAHDWALTWIITPEETIKTSLDHPQPRGLDWDRVRPEQFETIPLLRQLRSQMEEKE